MTGLLAVFWKEITDHFLSKRFIILMVLVYLAGIYAIYQASQGIRSVVTPEVQFVFIPLYWVTDPEATIQMSFVNLLMLLIPIIGIALGFDAINSERSTGNLSRILAQPVYRDSVINGKVLAGLVTIAVLITSIIALVAGMGLRMIGVPPTAEEVLRIFAFIFISIMYGAFWMSLAVLFSVVFRRIATALLASIGLLILFFLIQVIAPFIATAFIPDVQNPSPEMLAQAESIYNGIVHISPMVLYSDGFLALLAPELSTIQFSLSAASGITPGPLPLVQSILNIWPQIISLIALTAICFAISYILFMREEIRST